MTQVARVFEDRDTFHVVGDRLTMLYAWSCAAGLYAYVPNAMRDLLIKEAKSKVASHTNLQTPSKEWFITGSDSGVRDLIAAAVAIADEKHRETTGLNNGPLPSTPLVETNWRNARVTMLRWRTSVDTVWTDEFYDPGTGLYLAEMSVYRHSDRADAARKALSDLVEIGYLTPDYSTAVFW